MVTLRRQRIQVASHQRNRAAMSQRISDCKIGDTVFIEIRGGHRERLELLHLNGGGISGGQQRKRLTWLKLCRARGLPLRMHGTSHQESLYQRKKNLER